MYRALLLKNGFVFSEREHQITLYPSMEKQCWIVTVVDGGETVEIRSEDVFDLYHRDDRNQLPCSTYSLLSSSPANSPLATTCPIPNTPPIQPHALLFLQESLASLEAQVGSMRRLLAATFQQ